MITREIPWQNPVKLMQRLKHLPYSVLLDSSLNNRLGQYSIIAANPFCVLKSRNNRTTLIQNGKTKTLSENPFEALKSLLKNYELPITNYELPFNGGAIGFFSYDLLHHLEKIPRNRINDLKIPECIFGFYDSGVVFDHKNKKSLIVSIRSKDPLEKLEKQLLATASDGPPPENFSSTRLISNFTKKDYLRSVSKVKHYIREGEIYQVNLSQRFETGFNACPWDLYVKLRSASPNPFGGFFNFGDFQLLCSSPERFLKVRGNLVETRPMKGTRKRGETIKSDRDLKNELLNSKKDSAELLMITDLLRNDLGKVCEYGSVKVRRLKNLEKYRSVFQTTALIEGRLHRSKDRIDLLKACFPGGSITGAPKVRSMQIISELEPTARGPYTGALGYLDFCGNMDFNIIIRSIIIKNNRAYFQAGGGIVADSDPQKEYEETLIKARAMMKALQIKRGQAEFCNYSIQNSACPLGLFETMQSYRGKIFALDEHLNRLYRSSKKINLKITQSRARLKREIRRALKKKGLQNFTRAYIRLNVWREGKKSAFSIIVKKYSPPTKKQYKNGFKTIISSSRVDENSPLSSVKSLNYLFYSSAKNEAQKKGFDEAIFLNSKGFVAEGSRSNLFIVKDGRLLTPSLDCGILPGITRKIVIALAKKNKLRVKETRLSLSDLKNADESFLTNSLIQIIPLTSAGKSPINKGLVGPITRRLKGKLQNECCSG